MVHLSSYFSAKNAYTLFKSLWSFSHLLHRLVGRLPSPAVPGLDAFTGLKSNAPSSETERA